MRRAGIATRVDASGASIGKRYARNDELGTPFGCTIDFACECGASVLLASLSESHGGIFPPLSAVANGTLTLRERDTTDQLIGKIDDVIAVVSELVSGSIDWETASTKLEKYSGVQEIGE
jgi:glycyl-tRNA synthetase